MSALAATFPGIDRDVAVAGALLHDIGKVETYACRNGAIELTDAGKLLGEIPLGYYRVRRAIEEIEGFPATDADSLLHIILSHHGKLEHGSPVVPCTREATLVHFIDNLGGNLGSFDRIEKALAEGAAWSDFDRGIATAAYFGARERSGLSPPSGERPGWAFLPALGGALAHAPLLRYDLLPSLKRPLDLGAAPGGTRLFGDNKTIRGALAMASGTLAATLLLHRLEPYRRRLPAELREAGPLRHGALLGAAVGARRAAQQRAEAPARHRPRRARRAPRSAWRSPSTTRPTSCSAPGRCWRRSGACRRASWPRRSRSWRAFTWA